MNAQNEQRRPRALINAAFSLPITADASRAPSDFMTTLGRADGQTQIIIEMQVVFYCAASRTPCRYNVVKFAPDE
jgi:hypothetical protein